MSAEYEFDTVTLNTLNSLFRQPILGPDVEVRRVHPGDHEELSRILAIEEDPNKVRWFESRPENHTAKSRVEMVKYILDKKHHIILAAAGLPSRQDIHEAHEEEKLQGLVYVNPETAFRMQQLRDDQLIPDQYGMAADLVLEISYAKWGPAPHRQMADAVRQVCIGILSHSVWFGHTVAITAYVMEDERGSNEDSVHVLLASGFEEKGKVQYDAQARAKDRFFLLNEAKLDQIIAART